jgi:hypothetical protein
LAPLAEVAEGFFPMALPVRLIALSICALLCVAAAYDATLAYWRSQEPAVAANAPAFLRRDAILQLHASEIELAKSGKAETGSDAIRRNALAVLRHTPLDAKALRQLAIIVAMDKGESAARTYAQLAERLSRRDLQTQFLLVEIEARAGNVASTLAHYDRALMVHDEYRDRLFSQLSLAISAPAIRKALIRYAGRPWFMDFLSSATRQGGDPAAVVQLLAATQASVPPEKLDGLRAHLLGEFAGRGYFGALRQLLAEVPNGLASSLEAIGFSDSTMDVRLGPLSWDPRNDEAVQTSLGGTGEFEIGIAPARTALATHRVTLLAPGDYEILQVLTYDVASPRATLIWDVQCKTGGSSMIWRQRMPTAPGRVTYRAEFTIPKGCTAQQWRLTASADETQFTSHARLGSMRLVRR